MLARGSRVAACIKKFWGGAKDVVVDNADKELGGNLDKVEEVLDPGFCKKFAEWTELKSYADGIVAEATRLSEILKAVKAGTKSAVNEAKALMLRKAITSLADHIGSLACLFGKWGMDVEIYKNKILDLI